MIQYLRSVAVNDFRVHLNNIIQNQANHPGIALQSFTEMRTVFNKRDADLEDVLRSAVAYGTLLYATRMRSITGIDITLDGFEEQPDGSVLLTRTEYKCGSQRNVSKEVFVRLAPGKSLDRCTLVLLAEYFAGCSSKLPNQPFALGFRSIQGAGRTNQAKLPQSRFIALLHAAAIACGLPGGLSGEKKLHLLRMICENQLLKAGVSSKDREDFIGWDTSVQNRHYYTITKQRALESNA